MAFDFNALGKNDKVALISGAVSTVLLFFPAYAKASVEAKGDLGVSIGSYSESKSAFVEWASLGALLILAAFVIVVLRVVVGNLPAGVPWNLVTAAAAGLGTLILVIYVFTFGPDVPSIAEDSIDLSTGPGWSGWILLVAAIVFSVFSFFGFKDSGEQIPEFNKGTDGTPPPPAPPAPPTA